MIEAQFIVILGLQMLEGIFLIKLKVSLNLSLLWGFPEKLGVLKLF